MIWWCAEHRSGFNWLQAFPGPEQPTCDAARLMAYPENPSAPACRMVEALLIVKENELFPLGSVNRFEVIDWTIETGGRITSKWETYNYDVAFDIQDGGRTLKMFLMPLREEQ